MAIPVPSGTPETVLRLGSTTPLPPTAPSHTAVATYALMGGEGVAFGGLGRLVCAVVAEGSVVPVERDPADVPNGRSSVLCPPQMAAAAGLGASGGGGGA